MTSQFGKHRSIVPFEQESIACEKDEISSCEVPALSIDEMTAIIEKNETLLHTLQQQRHALFYELNINEESFHTFAHDPSSFSYDALQAVQEQAAALTDIEERHKGNEAPCLFLCRREKI